MASQPALTLSSLDVARLEPLLADLDTDTADRLADELARATVVQPAEIPPSVVTMNSTVRFAFEETSEEFELTLCYPRDASQPGRVSVLAPVGAALLGLAVGDRIDWPLPSGDKRRVCVRELVYQPERAGDLHR